MKAWQLIEQGWCQFNTAETAEGKRVPCRSPEAARWSMDGALYRAYQDHATYYAMTAKAAKAILKKCGIGDPEPIIAIARFHEHRSTRKADVVAILKEIEGQ